MVGRDKLAESCRLPLSGALFGTHEIIIPYYRAVILYGLGDMKLHVYTSILISKQL